MGGMRRYYDDEAARRREQVIACFGEARLVKTLAGKLEIRGGSKADQDEARQWARRFLTPARPGTAPRFNATCAWDTSAGART